MDFNYGIFIVPCIIIFVGFFYSSRVSTEVKSFVWNLILLAEDTFGRGEGSLKKDFVLSQLQIAGFIKTEKQKEKISILIDKYVSRMNSQLTNKKE